MIVVQINATCGVGSTGKICLGISELLNNNRIENYILFSSMGNDYQLGIRCSSDRYIKLQAVKSRILGNYGFNSKKETRRIISEIERINPDIVHIHNIHGHDCDIEVLFRYFKKTNTKLVWTFHDCWAFTAYCPHFTICGCEKWKTACRDCPQYKDYSLFFDRSKTIFEKKRELFNGLDLTIVTPSKWLREIVLQSIFKDYPVKTINNGIDTNVFRPTENSFREHYKIHADKKIILGVAFSWDYKKGLDVFVELSKRLDKEKYAIVLVGAGYLNGNIPENIIAIPRTESRGKLAEIYTAADVFVNPTREEVLGLVNIEANACGTPVITFNTGGSPECINKKSGITVPCGDVDTLQKSIEKICLNKVIKSTDCIKKAAEFDKSKTYTEYVKLYEEIYDGTSKA